MYDFANAAADRSRDASADFRVAAGATGAGRIDQGKTIGVDSTTLEANAAM
jgi:hypothetical protein